ncbi:MAG: lipid-A-disaccharide synthase [Candidatus Cloacimonetes bacterium]|nr:lipid-A-disaccharide synthase [Candidatus Cloacimonadota bacterium]
MKTIFWLAGETSGDLHASEVIAELTRRFGKYRHIGIGGPRMKERGLEQLYPFNRFNVMGFTEVIKHLRFFMKVEKRIRKLLRQELPDLVVLVDYPGFNLRIARIADDEGIPVLYYICPQFWAWNHKRVHQLKDYTRHVACILPFEKDLLDIHRINATYVGHPIAEEVNIELGREGFAEAHGLDPDMQWIGFLPGSRDMEIERLLPLYLEASRYFDRTRYQLLISKSHSVSNKLFFDMIEQYDAGHVHIIGGNTYEMMKYCRALACTSGTATLEAAYIGTPAVIVYKASKLTYFVAKRYVGIERIGLPNIVLGENVLPELIQDAATPGALYQRMLFLLEDGPERERIIAKLGELHEMLGGKHASSEVADLMEKLLESRLYVSL